MADTLTITLPAPLADEVRAAAEARGVSPEEYVRQQLAFDIALDGDGFDDDDIEEDLAAAAEFERTGVGVPWEKVRLDGVVGNGCRTASAATAKAPLTGRCS